MKIFQTLFLALCILSSNSMLSAQGFKVSCAGFYNLENLFDTEDDPKIRDDEYTPEGRRAWTMERYKSKQNHMADVIRQVSTEVCPEGLAVLGVSEVENRKVLEDLVIDPSIAIRDYQIVHYDSPDERGIDVGLLYNPRFFKFIGSKKHELLLIDEADSSRNYTRDVLHATGLMDGDTVHVLVNHWPSRSGGQAKSEWGRVGAAQLNRKIVDSLLNLNKEANIIIMGDLNDDPTDNSLTKALKTSRNPKRMGKSGLYNPFYEMYKSGAGTLAYRDSWNLFDQMIVSKALSSRRTGTWFLYRSKIFKKKFLLQPDGPYKGYPFRTFAGGEFLNGYSDHLPVYTIFMKKK